MTQRPVSRGLPFRSSLFLMFLLLGGSAAAALAQQPYRVDPDEVPRATRAFAITNARIVQAPGQVIQGGTVVIRGGLIEAVGVNVDVPYDAEVIEGDTLWVYAGFIDGLSHVAVPKPREERSQERVPRRGDPPYDRAGIQPQRDVIDFIDREEAAIENFRRLGFTAAHVVPHGNMLPGRGAVIQLTGRDPNEMMLRSDASLFAQFEGASGVYPSTTMAIMARWRQLFRESARRQQLAATYVGDPAGLERPPHDAVMQAFRPVVDGSVPVFFRTQTSLDARRAMRLSDELGFRVVLADLKEGWYVADELSDNNPPVLLSLDLPEEQANNNRDTTAAAGGNNDRVRTHADLEDERERLEARRGAFREQFFRNAAELHEAGVRFGFATIETEANKVRANLRKMIEHGLPEDAAIAALTTNPAGILGLRNELGTVERGKIGNLVVTTGPYFDEDSQVRMVFVDGLRFEYEVREPRPDEEDDPDAVLNPVGTWSATVDTPDGPVRGTIEFSGRPEALTGIMRTDIGTGDVQLRNIILDGSVLTWNATVVLEGQSFSTSFSGTLRPDSLEGSISIPGMGSFPLRASRTSGPDA